MRPDVATRRVRKCERDEMRTTGNCGDIAERLYIELKFENAGAMQKSWRQRRCGSRKFRDRQTPVWIRKQYFFNKIPIHKYFSFIHLNFSGLFNGSSACIVPVSYYLPMDVLYWFISWWNTHREQLIYRERQKERETVQRYFGDNNDCAIRE